LYQWRALHQSDQPNAVREEYRTYFDSATDTWSQPAELVLIDDWALSSFSRYLVSLHDDRPATIIRRTLTRQSDKQHRCNNLWPDNVLLPDSATSLITLRRQAHGRWRRQSSSQKLCTPRLTRWVTILGHLRPELCIRRSQPTKSSGSTCATNTKPALDPQPYRMKIVLNLYSAIERDETPHGTNSTPKRHV
jgi:hypothetical protein